jgi:hypothetical protein
MLVKQPQKYGRYLQLKQNLESFSEDDPIVPQWFKDQYSIRLPFGGEDGQGMYLFPDAPFKSAFQMADPRQLLGSVNPIIKTPVELSTGSKVWNQVPFTNESAEIPSSWGGQPMGAALAAVGLASKGKNGQYYMQDKHAYVMEQFMPLLGRARRLAPSEQKYQDRAVTSWVSFLSGFSVRTNTQSDQRSELYRRRQHLDQMAESLQSLGYGGYDTWQGVRADLGTEGEAGVAHAEAMEKANAELVKIAKGR